MKRRRPLLYEVDGRRNHQSGPFDRKDRKNRQKTLAGPGWHYNESAPFRLEPCIQRIRLMRHRLESVVQNEIRQFGIRFGGIMNGNPRRIENTEDRRIFGCVGTPQTDPVVITQKRRNLFRRRLFPEIQQKRSGIKRNRRRQHCGTLLSGNGGAAAAGDFNVAVIGNE